MLKVYEDGDLIVVGDFNCTLNSELDIISGYPHDKLETETFKHTIELLGLTDIWRLYHATEKDFTWARLNPFTARRLDYCFVSESILSDCTSCVHSFVTNSDHKAVVLDLNESDFIRGPGYWRFNNSFLKNDIFVQNMNKLLDTFKTENRELDSVEQWEMCKVEISHFCIDFGKTLSCQKRN
eukprot:TRINITY_DN133858_c0_g1_i1.p1 TRINITY_DN133858_c0_g1~~TRINITY_DN133858_c0_g1_i1.p1  ORF type:complete len:182 (-),score=8.47 TRINITY_DN133858_c0_g1_i1:60-605(-)